MEISSSSSHGTSPRKQTLQPKIDGPSVMESTSYLHHAPTTFVGSRDEDYLPIRSFKDAKNICFAETAKLWAIAGPIAFNLLCYYSINSATSIFAGHIGDLELSAVAISLSVISTFSFGFLVITFYNNSWLQQFSRISIWFHPSTYFFFIYTHHIE